MDRTLSFEDALALVLEEAANVRPSSTTSLALGEALERVLAEDLRADRDQPPFARSTRDGFAMRAADVSETLTVVGQVRAGAHWTLPPLGPKEAAEIMTGAPVPPGADAVVMVEHTASEGDYLRIHENRTLRSGENIVPQGAEAASGEPLLFKGDLLLAAEIALAASLGHHTVRVYDRPTAAILATGDELVPVMSVPEVWQIRNSNTHGLAALTTQEGGQPLPLAIARDTLADLTAQIEAAGRCDLLILSGGVSMGKYDFVEQALEHLGAEFFFTGVWMQPGKPVVFGRLPRPGSAQPARDWMYFFGLPGNPVSTQVTFRLFVAPLLRALAGRTEVKPAFVEARLQQDVPGNPRLVRFLPARVEHSWRAVHVRPVSWQGSGDMAANARANAYLVLPERVEGFAAGETVRVMLR